MAKRFNTNAATWSVWRKGTRVNITNKTTVQSLELVNNKVTPQLSIIRAIEIDV